jgi:hypothetical protein
MSLVILWLMMEVLFKMTMNCILLINISNRFKCNFSLFKFLFFFFFHIIGGILLKGVGINIYDFVLLLLYISLTTM